MTPEFYDYVLMGPSATCRDQYCMALGSTGNNDLTGIGVWIILFFYLPTQSLHSHFADGL